MDRLGLRFFLWFTRPVWREALGPAADGLSSAALRELDPLLVAIPPLGKPAARTFLVATCWMVAVHRVLHARTAAENGALFSKATDYALRRIPRPLVVLRRWLFFQPWYHRRLLADIVGGSKEGFVGELVPAAGGFGVDYTECALQKFLAKTGNTDLGPYVCQLDFVESNVFGLGLVRTGTLSTGAPRCDFRWRR